MNFITARLFTVYGPGEHPDRLLPSLIRAAHSAETLALTAGIQMRDFTYVEDVAEGLLRLGSSKCQPGEIINLATGQIHEVRDFVQNAAQLLGITADKLNFGALPTRSEEMRHDPINIDRLRSITGWQPGTPIQEGILRTVQFEIQ